MAIEQNFSMCKHCTYRICDRKDCALVAPLLDSLETHVGFLGEILSKELYGKNEVKTGIMPSLEQIKEALKI